MKNNQNIIKYDKNILKSNTLVINEHFNEFLINNINSKYININFKVPYSKLKLEKIINKIKIDNSKDYKVTILDDNNSIIPILIIKNNIFSNILNYLSYILNKKYYYSIITFKLIYNNSNLIKNIIIDKKNIFNNEHNLLINLFISDILININKDKYYLSYENIIINQKIDSSLIFQNDIEINIKKNIISKLLSTEISEEIDNFKISILNIKYKEENIIKYLNNFISKLYKKLNIYTNDIFYDNKYVFNYLEDFIYRLLFNEIIDIYNLEFEELNKIFNIKHLILNKIEYKKIFKDLEIKQKFQLINNNNPYILSINILNKLKYYKTPLEILV